MTDKIENLMLEHFRSLRQDIVKLTASHENLAAEVHVSNAHVAALVQGEVNTK